ncbi:hypothetical protein [Streptomyces sp. MZ04]|uniref:hypothetical protein n=1 Tax=Streptomyces sp. MZ04 TaxID=2559236 RepID=UPI00107EE516|nr:hypothetical protein [Streptomyces sp. MZ04]TGA98238.1 hypothetical protein E2651_30645 [Streptomyces sp. MZ04]
MEGASARPRRRKAVVWLLAGCVVWTLAVVIWAAVALLSPDSPPPEEAVERRAAMHHEQHHPDLRFYVPTYAKTHKDGTSVLRYRVGDSDDSGVADFLRTYDITAEPRRTGPSEEKYADRFGGVRRTVMVVYAQPADGEGHFDSAARITVRAR